MPEGSPLETLIVAIEASYGKMTASVQQAVASAQRQLSVLEQRPTQLPPADTRAFAASMQAAGSSGASLVSNLIGGFQRLGFAIFGAQQTFNAFVAAANGLVGFNANLEQAEMSWKTMLGSEENAKAMLNELMVFAARTPFNFPQVQEGARRLMAMGIEAKNVLPLLTDISNVTATMGLGNEGIRRMTLALGQMNAKGKVSQEEILQLTDIGVNAGEIFEVMAQKTGKTTAELKRLQEQGRLSSDQFIAAFQQWAQTRFGDATAQQAATWQGAISTIQDSLQIVQATALQPFFERLSKLAQSIASFVQTDEFAAWGGRVAAVLDVVLSGIDTLASGFADGLGAVLDVVITIGTAIYEALSWINPFAEHSPSLVSQVEAGVERISGAYDSLASTTSTQASTLETAMTKVTAAVTGPLDELEKRLSQAENNLKRFVNTPITGSKEFEKRRNALDDAMARIELAMARMRAAGTDKYSRMDRGKAVTETTEGYKKLEGQLASLRAQADVVRLEERVQLDPLRRELKDIADDKIEMPFEDLARGARAAKKEVDALTPAVAALKATTAKGGGGGGAKSLAGAIAGAKGEQKNALDFLNDAKERLRKTNEEYERMKKAALEALKPVTDLWTAVFGKNTPKIESGGYEWIERQRGLIDDLKDAYRTGGIAGVGQWAWDQIVASFNAVPWGTIWSRVETRAAEVWSGFTIWLFGTEGNNGAVKKVTDAVVSIFNSVPWNSVWDQVKKTRSSLIDLQIDWLFGAEMKQGVGQGSERTGGVVKAISDAVRKAVESIDWKATFKAAKDTSQEAQYGATEWILGTLKRIDWKGIENKAKQAIGEYFRIDDVLREAFGLNKMPESRGGMLANPTAMMMPFIAPLYAAVENVDWGAVSKAANDLILKAAYVWGSAWGQFGAILMTMTGATMNIAAGLINWLNALLLNVDMKQVGAAVFQFIANFATGLVAGFLSVDWPTTLAGIAVGFANLVIALGNFLLAAAKAIVEFNIGFYDALLSALGLPPAAIQEMADQYIVRPLVSAVSSLFAGGTDVFKWSDLWNSVLGFLTLGISGQNVRLYQIALSWVTAFWEQILKWALSPSVFDWAKAWASVLSLLGIGIEAQNATTQLIALTFVQKLYNGIVSSLQSQFANIGSIIEQYVLGPIRSALGVTIPVKVIAEQASNDVGTTDAKRATGGPVWPGGSFLVGERGPEPFVPSRWGTVLPNSVLQQQTTTAMINVNLNGPVYDAADARRQAGIGAVQAVRALGIGVA